MKGKKYSNFYTDSKFKTVNNKLEKVKDENNYLFAKGIYKTKISEDELPENFIKLYYGVRNHYISIINIKDMVYKANYFTNHLYKDDFLYISYETTIKKEKNSNHFIDYDVLIYGLAIVDFIKEVKRAESYDVKNIEIELERKKKWYEDRQEKEI